jgi:hypothetical protein
MYWQGKLLRRVNLHSVILSLSKDQFGLLRRSTTAEVAGAGSAPDRRGARDGYPRNRSFDKLRMTDESE